MNVIVNLMILLVGFICPLQARAQILVTDHLTSWESTWGGRTLSNYRYTGRFFSADTVTTLLWFGNSKLYPTASDVTWVIKGDTLGTSFSTDTMKINATFYPVVSNAGTAFVMTKTQHCGTLLTDLGIPAIQYETGDTLTAFTIQPGTVYTAGHPGWWGGMDIVGIVGEFVSLGADSFYFDAIAEYMGNR